jgi:hypothetical protein
MTLKFKLFGDKWQNSGYLGRKVALRGERGLREVAG